MTLHERLTELIQACFTGLWIESHEHEDALREMAQLCRDQDWRLATWNLETGLTIPGAETPPASTGQDPLAVLRSLSSLGSESQTSLLVLENFHRFLQSTEVVQALIRQIQVGKQHRTFVVILAPMVNIPVELEKLFIVIEHDLPSREQLAEIAKQIATEPSELPTGRDWETVLDAAAGLTRYEAEGAFSLSLV